MRFALFTGSSSCSLADMRPPLPIFVAHESWQVAAERALEKKVVADVKAAEEKEEENFAYEAKALDAALEKKKKMM